HSVRGDGALEWARNLFRRNAATGPLMKTSSTSRRQLSRSLALRPSFTRRTFQRREVLLSTECTLTVLDSCQPVSRQSTSLGLPLPTCHLAERARALHRGEL